MLNTVPGRSEERFEDPALLSGRAMYAADYPVPRGTLYAAILRSPHAHAEISEKGKPMNEGKYREVVTIHGTNVTLERAGSPVENLGIAAGAELFKFLSVLDAKFRPENYDKADGAPLRLFDSDAVKIDVSKRSKEDMGFWHRNVDYNEIIFCFRGALRWETEMGTVTLREGDMILIPKGITHRSMLCDDSIEENILIELKVRDALDFVGGA